MTSKKPASSKRSLSVNLTDHRECHIGGDFLLLYRIDGSGENEQVVFVQAGTHAELFE